MSTPAVVGICLGATLLLFSVAAVSCFCYRGHQQQTRRKLRSPGHLDNRALAFRKPTAVKSPIGQQHYPSHHAPVASAAALAHHLKKSPSPTGTKTPPGSCPIGKTSSPLSGSAPTASSRLAAYVCMLHSNQLEAGCELLKVVGCSWAVWRCFHSFFCCCLNNEAGTTPSTLTPTFESPQTSRKNSLIAGNRCSLVFDEHGQVVQQQPARETVIRFQLENENRSDAARNDALDAQSADASAGEGANRLGRLFFKVR